MKEVGKIYSAVDADELEAGDLVVCGDNLSDAGDKNKEPCELQRIEGEGVDYRFVAIDEFSYGWALARLVCPKKHAETYKAWKTGAKVEMYVCPTWMSVEDPDWSETYNYRIREEDPYAELKKAHAEGKTIQILTLTDEWVDCEPYWDSDVKCYRVKPEPKTRRMTNKELAKIGEEAILKIKEMIEELSNDNEEE